MSAFINFKTKKRAEARFLLFYINLFALIKFPYGIFRVPLKNDHKYAKK